MSYKLIIITGAPGSGKTTLSKKLSSSEVYSPKSKSIMEKIMTAKKVVVEGMFTSKSLEKFIRKLTNKRVPSSIEIITFQKDKNNCFANDIGRCNDSKSGRDTLSFQTIKRFKNLSEESILDTLKDLQEEFPSIKLTVTEKEVECYYPHYLWAIEVSSSMQSGFSEPFDFDRRQFRSEMWITGGSERSYTGESWEVEAESPKEFDEFSDLVEKYFEGMSFIHYMKILKMARIEQFYDGDYYYSYEKEFYAIPIKDLYEVLIKYGYISNS